ncbi:glycosyltransferase family 4 protein [Rubellicoccus peritrichatus]|uniref:Glycosyltransferase family 4 protein n=1 Tax=Rubellicoccus peritrichatus TaxID=3080537 RepID=A0AAQ3LCM8_9BACT|nr:glycosyltransferase family 4 protein [Puniceicoccus sp. CR14]WOO42927.1 glycosyltransferase family 4 protein [Puniceicoccus sp. CR14]
MRILYVHQYFSTPSGAAGTRSYEFGKRLVQAGHDVTILCGESSLTRVCGVKKDTAGHFDVEGMQVIQVPISSSNQDSYLKRVLSFSKFSVVSAKFALKLDYELILTSSTPLTVGIPGLVAKVFRRKKFVFEVRDLWPELPRAMGIIRNRLVLSLLSSFEVCCYRAADACIGLSPGIVAGIRAKKAGGEVLEISNGCDLDYFKPGGSSSFPIKGVNDGDFRAVFCGAHGRANGLNAILDAASELKKCQRIDVKLIFIGDGQLKKSLIARAKTEKLENCIFLDPMPKEELAQLMSCADLGLMVLADVEAFHYGTSPNKFFDYIASGLPVLCNYPGWVSDLIAQWDCGVSLPPGDRHAFAEALVQMADNRNRTRLLGKNARKLAESQFDRDVLFQRLRDLLMRL